MATDFKNIQKQLIVPILACDVNGGKISEYISLKNVAHVSLVVITQAMAASTNMTIRRAKTVAGGSAESWTGWDEVFVRTNFSGYLAEDASPTLDFTRTTVSTYTKALAVARSIYVTEFDPVRLGISDGWDCVGVGFSDPSGSDIITVFAICDMQIGGEAPPDVQTD